MELLIEQAEEGKRKYSIINAIIAPFQPVITLIIAPVIVFVISKGIEQMIGQ